jgi:hypothetical protein
MRTLHTNIRHNLHGYDPSLSSRLVFGPSIMPSSTYKQPSQKLQIPSVHPRPLAPIQPAPFNSVFYSLNNFNPSVPSPQAVPRPFTTGFARTRHIVPAAFPRTHHTIRLDDYPEAPPDETNEERKARMTLVGKELVAKKRSLENNTGELELDTSPVFLLEVDRYARTNIQPQVRDERSSPGLTLFLAHANGFHKEVSSSSHA